MLIIVLYHYTCVQAGVHTPGQGRITDYSHTYQMHDPRQQRLVPDNHVPSTVSILVHMCAKIIPNKCVLVIYSTCM